MNPLTPDNVSLWIVSYRRLGLLRNTIAEWLLSYPFERVNVLANDPSVDYSSILSEFGDVIQLWPNIFRHPWMVGSIAQSWNTCMLHTFLEHDWCLMSQDDVHVRPGWDQLVTGNPYLTYLAPVGDIITLQSREGFHRVGWYDERFRAIGGPEADMVLRIMRAYPQEASIHDGHPWHLHHNTVGLEHRYWEGTVKNDPEHVATWKMHRFGLADLECFGRWNQKWGEDVNEMLVRLVRNGLWHEVQPQVGWDEIDWYPSFTQRLKELGR